MQNPLESYRRAQRELRRQFEAFTRENCPTCPTPCCRRPARIAPTDILLAEATGWRANLPMSLPESSAETRASASPDMITMTAGRMADALGHTEEAGSGEGEIAGLPCEYLGDKGCTFPADLRPFGCTTYICKYMYARLDRPTLTRIKRLTRDLEDKHTILLRSIRNVRWNEETEDE